MLCRCVANPGQKRDAAGPGVAGIPGRLSVLLDANCKLPQATTKYSLAGWSAQ